MQYRRPPQWRMNMTIGKWRTRALDYSALLLCSIPMYMVLRMVFNAVAFPMELEVREGVSWLHVLTQAKGISIFDHTQVAYYGMHGPVDHLIKTVFHILIPSLPSQSVIRITVLLLPFCVFYM